MVDIGRNRNHHAITATRARTTHEGGRERPDPTGTEFIGGAPTKDTRQSEKPEHPVFQPYLTVRPYLPSFTKADLLLTRHYSLVQLNTTPFRQFFPFLFYRLGLLIQKETDT